MERDSFKPNVGVLKRSIAAKCLLYKLYHREIGQLTDEGLLVLEELAKAAASFHGARIVYRSCRVRHKRLQCSFLRH